LATIALLALVAFAATVTFRDVNGPTGRLSTLPAFAPSIPAGLTYEPVDSADCTMSARVSGTTYSLVGETPHQTPMLPKFGIMTNPDFQEVDPSTVMAGLPDADATTISGIGATLHEASACRFYSGAQKADGVVQYLDLDSRYFALFSGDFFRKELTRTMMYGSDATVLEGAWMPIGPASWKVDKASMLPNGRVIAIVSSTDQAKPCLTTNARMVMVFEESGGRWYIDEVARVKSPATVACPDGVSQYLDIGITDSLRSEIDATPDEIAFHSDRPITVTVANLGLIPQEFTIDELQISVLIEPGHSASFVLNATRGQYVMASYPSQFGQTDFTNQRLGAILKVVAPGVSTSQG